MLYGFSSSPANAHATCFFFRYYRGSDFLFKGVGFAGRIFYPSKCSISRDPRYC